MGSLLTNRRSRISRSAFNAASTIACDIGFGAGFRMDQTEGQCGKIETTDQIVVGDVWQVTAYGKTHYEWGCRYGRSSASDWEQTGSGENIYQAMLGLTAAMFTFRAKHLIRKPERQLLQDR